MALCNVPVISTDTGFVSSTLAGVKNSYSCATEHELVTSLNTVLDDGRRSDGRKKASEWDIETMGEELLEVYTTLVEKSN